MKPFIRCLSHCGRQNLHFSLMLREKKKKNGLAGVRAALHTIMVRAIGKPGDSLPLGKRMHKIKDVLNS